MRIVCSARQSTVAVDELLREEEPLVVYAEPFTGLQTLTLEISSHQGFQVLAVGQQGPHVLSHVALELSSLPAAFFLLTTDLRHGYTAYLCLNHSDLTSNLVNSRLVLQSGESRASQRTRAVLVCVRGSDLQSTLHRAFREALRETGNVGKVLSDKPALPDFLNFLGWQSGVAFGKNVGHGAILDAMESLLEQGLRVGYVLIDEGWQATEINPHSDPQFPALLSFEADAENFPGGLLSLSHDLRHLEISHVGVWHAMMGHRGGIHPALAQQYGLPHDGQGRFYLGHHLGSTFQFFYDYYEQLKSEGITFVQIGAQQEVPTFCPHGDLGDLYRTLNVALQAAASIHFNNVQLNSDCLNSAGLFYWTTSPIAATGLYSDLHQQLRLSLLLRPTVLPDFGGWISTAQNAEAVAIFHALSGSLNRIGDPPEEVATHYIRRTALPSGRIFRADIPLTLTKDSLFSQQTPYKAYTLKGNCGILGIFNSSGHVVHTPVAGQELTGLEGDLFAVYSYRHGFLGIKPPTELFEIRLKADESDVVTFAPLHQGIALIGFFGLYLGPGPIIEMHTDVDALYISSHVSGHALLYSERDILEVRRNGVVIPWEQNRENRFVAIDTRRALAETPTLYTVTFEG